MCIISVTSCGVLDANRSYALFPCYVGDVEVKRANGKGVKLVMRIPPSTYRNRRLLRGESLHLEGGVDSGTDTPVLVGTLFGR
jgi:hypothetical protein